MNKQQLISGILAVALAVSLTVNIVLWIVWPKDGVPTVDPSDTTTTTVYKDMIDIKTPYGTMKFPAAFDDVRHEASEKDGVYTVSFSYHRDEEAMEMYAVHFGDEERGTLMGYVQQNGKDVPFTVTSTKEFAEVEWAEEEQDHIKALMMAVNDVIASVQQWEGFVG